MLVDRISRARKSATPLTFSQNSSDASTVMFGSAEYVKDGLLPLAEYCIQFGLATASGDRPAATSA